MEDLGIRLWTPGFAKSDPSRLLGYWLWPGPVCYSSHQPHMTTEHPKGGQFK